MYHKFVRNFIFVVFFVVALFASGSKDVLADNCPSSCLDSTACGNLNGVLDFSLSDNCDVTHSLYCCIFPTPTPGIPSPTPIDCNDPAVVPNPLLVPSCALKQFPNLAMYVINMAIMAAAITGLLSLIYGGFLYVTAQDDPSKVEKGRKTVLWAFMGLVVAGSLYIFMSFITGLLNIPGYSVVPVAYAEETQNTYQVYGTIRDGNDNLLPGANVTLYEKSGDKWIVWNAKSFGNQRNPFEADVFGHYQFFAPNGTYYVVASKFGFHTQESHSFDVADTPIKQNLSLTAASSIWVAIVYFGVILFVGSVLYMIVVAIVRWRKREQLKQYARGKILGSEQKKSNTSTSVDSGSAHD